MPRAATGELRPLADGGWEARVTIQGRERKGFRLPPMEREKADGLCRRMSETAKRGRSLRTSPSRVVEVLERVAATVTADETLCFEQRKDTTVKTEQKAPVAVLTSITPAMAQQWLQANAENQRNINRLRVEGLVEKIRKGKWVVDGATIKISKSGRLIDGQHRLSAIAQSGVPCVSFVVTGLDDEAIETIDTGMIRRNAHVMHMKLGEGVGNQQASVATQIFKIERGSSAGGVISASDVISAYEQHRESIEWSLSAVGYRIEPGIRSGGAPVLGAIAFMRVLDPERIADFCDVFRSGVDSNKRNPAMQLRSAVANQADSSAVGRWDLTLKSLRALEAACDGDGLGVLKSDPMVLRRANARVQSMRGSSRP